MRRAGRRASVHGLGRCPARRARAAGFTLLEMVVVMVIIAAAMLLGAMATTGGTARMQLHSSTKQIAANLRYTRAQAIATGEPQRFTIDPQGHAWQAPNGRHGAIPEALEVNFTGARQVQPQAGVGAIMFFDDGASTGGRVQLARGDAAWNVDVAWLTGEVTLRRAERGQ
ncbi:GspH/FimT family pseudopilin [Luteimonas soli]|uniref:Type II secretion system protein H n=1 Tax=Luteimonas soli TaxID=1648966 RepID=A0ABV7XF96_9GAMM